MELFHQDGHLTDEGLDAVIAGTLDELQSLEAAEHLSFCDECLMRYTDRLTDDVLAAPEQPLAPTVMERVRRKALKVFFNRYAVAAVAACLALTLWGTGVFSAISPGENLRVMQEPPKTSMTINTRMSLFFQNSGQALQNTINDLISRVQGAAKS